MKHATPRARFGFLVHDVSRMRRTLFDQALKPLGITRAQWWALGNLSRHADTGMIQTELAHILETGKVSVGGLIDRLESSGLVYRKADDSDRRVKRIYMTDAGFDLLEKISIIGNRLNRLVFTDLSEDDLETTSRVLMQVKNNIRSYLRSDAIGNLIAEDSIDIVLAPEPARTAKSAGRRKANKQTA